LDQGKKRKKTIQKTNREGRAEDGKPPPRFSPLKLAGPRGGGGGGRGREGGLGGGGGGKRCGAKRMGKTRPYLSSKRLQGVRARDDRG